MQSAKRILMIGPMHETVMQHTAKHYDVLELWRHDNPLEVLQAQGKGIEAVITGAFFGIKNEYLDFLPDVKVVSTFGVGYDSIDTQALSERGIQLGNTPDVLNDAVADTAIALLLAVVREVVRTDRYVREGRWPQGFYGLTPNVSGKKVGIVGLGSIGKVIAKRLGGFDCEIAYHNRSQRTDVDYAYFLSLNDLAAWSDFLIVATVGGAQTQHLINAQVLAALGPQGYLVNIARGTVVDEDALLKALQEKTIAGAGLDVFTNEPHVPEAFYALDNVVLMPHLASATHETREAMAQRVIENLEAFFQHGEVVSRVV